MDGAEHNDWFRARVLEALADTRPDLPHEDVEVHFAKRRAEALRRAEDIGT